MANPCEVLQQNSADTKLQSKMDSIKTRVLSITPDRDTLETQLVIDKADGQTYYNIYSNTSAGGGLTSVTGDVNQFTVARAHNHVENAIPIFSYADIVTLYDTYKFLPPSKRKIYKEYLVSYNNTTYALQINDLSYLDTLFAGINLGTLTTTEEDKKSAQEIVKNIYDENLLLKADHNYTQLEAEQKFLKSLNHALMGIGNSIHLYRKDADGWGKLNIDASGNITKENCP